MRGILGGVIKKGLVKKSEKYYLFGIEEPGPKVKNMKTERLGTNFLLLNKYDCWIISILNLNNLKKIHFNRVTVAH